MGKPDRGPLWNWPRESRIAELRRRAAFLLDRGQAADWLALADRLEREQRRPGRKRSVRKRPAGK